MAFSDDGRLLCNKRIGESDININQTQETATIRQLIEGGYKGRLHLYLVANEADYEAKTSSQYSEYLQEVLPKITTEADLQQFLVRYNPANPRGGYTSEIKPGRPLLMVGRAVAYIPGGQQEVSIGIVDLVRTFARLTVSFRMKDAADLAGTITQLQLVGPSAGFVPTIYPLTERTAEPYYEPMEFYPFSFDLLKATDEHGDPNETRIVDDPVLAPGNDTFQAYLPERIFSATDNVEKNAWRLQVKIRKANGQEISGEISLNNFDEILQQGDLSDYSIHRNTDYIVHATISTIEPLRLQLTVAPWIEKEVNIEWSHEHDFSLTSIAGAGGVETVKKNDVTYIPIRHDLNTGRQDGDVFINFHLSKPAGSRWSASLSDGQNFEFVGPSSGDIPALDGADPGTPAAAEHTIQIRATNPLPDGTPHRNVGLVIRLRHPNGDWERLLINKRDEEVGQWTTSGDDEALLIRQIRATGTDSTPGTDDTNGN